eukprot:CAMPEP_0172328012 /NCGR_PEP_ID=MMETSP1058-20130122/60131_1 /TAXON_ID=83371 /ORGANISM="Detonula confervacea, Strain CCMP 353" /LENGTH=77 /DNA_ID=CAMNT_0013045109 /DNA_START=1217 /DNA_END=1450 /DNA_ORIENTATION=+
MTTPPTKSSSFKNPFSSGLGKTGRMGAWVAAIGIVAAWNYYENQNNTSDSFSKGEQESWNDQKKKVASSAAAADASK